MTLSPGARLGPYEIEAVLGAGGFGEVYKARDTRLGRLVALKVLLPQIAEDPMFRERFEREARVISKLTHPNICTLYDIGLYEKTDFLVMEFLEGETLAARIQRGGLAIDETLRIATQIAEALICAHGAGIVHRDLKPANVFLTRTGLGSSGAPQVKLLDFGLAKAGVLSGGPTDVTSPVAPQTVTAQGTILGTLQYMAPEQIEGVDADTRADIWAFGAIFHEMVTGRAAFEARTPASLIAAVLTQRPQPVREAQPQAPRALERLIEGCFEKDREQRWQNIRDVKRQLAAVATPDEPRAAGAAPISPDAARRSSLRVGAIGGGILGLILGGVIAYVIAGRLGGTSPSAPLVRFEIRPTAGSNIPHTDDTAQYIAPSPDGTRMAFVAGGRLWIKRLDGAAAEEVAGTRGASSPFWSPDGRSIAFFGDRQLKKKVLDGGPPETLCAVSGTGNNGTWNADGVILFDDWNKRGLQRISADGGTPTVVGDAAQDVAWPQFLPDGRHYLYVVAPANAIQQAFVGALDSSDATELPGVRSRVEYAGGYVLFRRDGALLAQPFDPRRLKLTGSAMAVADLVVGFVSTGFAAFSAGGSNLLVYQAIAPANRLVWVDREGREGETIGTPRDYNVLRLSPDESAVAVSVRDPQLGTNDIWIHDFRRNIDTRLTSEKQSENSPVWSPDGRTIVYAADRAGPPHLHARDVSGSAERMVTAPSTDVQATTAVTPDGRMVLYSDSAPGTGRDVLMAPLDGIGSPVPLVRTKGQDLGARPSPDGKWLAYSSNESGRAEVYVRPFRDEQTRWQVSRAGGNNAKWRGDGRELFYVEGGRRMMSVEVSAGPTVDVGAPRLLFARDAFGDYDVTADGRRFLFSMLDPEAETGALKAVLNWTALLRR